MKTQPHFHELQSKTLPCEDFFAKIWLDIDRLIVWLKFQVGVNALPRLFKINGFTVYGYVQ